ncbi:Glycosyl transferase, group 1 domain protein [Rhodopirellula sp. SWK7]|nr:Glycosyl transferase, group 1 domain protein [Rhodopirellula sp. SWK7]
MERSTPLSKLPEMIHLGLGWIGDHGGGLERYQHGVCTAHANAGEAVTAWVQSRTPITSDVNYNVVAFASQDQPRRQKLANLCKLASERHSGDPYLMISHHASVGASLAERKGPKTGIVHFHGPWADEASVEGAPWWKTIVQRRTERLSYQSASRVITLSTFFKNIAVEKYDVDADRVCIVPGGIDANKADPGVSRLHARALLNWPTDRPIALTVRRLVRRVGVDVLLEALPAVVSKHPDLLLMIGGSGPMKQQLQQRVADLGLHDNVQLLGFIPEAELSLAYCAADFSIVPTQELEGFGLVVIESMATGTPALVTPVGSLPEVVDGLSKDLTVDDKSSTAIADGIIQAIAGDRRLPSDQQCKDYVRENFDWTVISPKLLDVYREAVR